MRMWRNLPRRSTFCSRSEMASKSSGGCDLAAKCFFSKLNNTSGTDVVHAATLDGKGSSVSCLSGPADSEDNVSIASIMFPLIFELYTHASLHSIQLSLVHGCAQCSGWRVSSSSVSTVHMSFNLVRYSVTVDSSTFAVSLFLGDVGNLIIVKSMFWHFATSCDHNCKSDIESHMV